MLQACAAGFFNSTDKRQANNRSEFKSLLANFFSAFGLLNSDDSSEIALKAFLQLQSGRASAVLAAANKAAAAEAESRTAKSSSKGGGAAGGGGAQALQGAAGTGAVSNKATAVPNVLLPAGQESVAMNGAFHALVTLMCDPGLCASDLGHCARSKSSPLCELLSLAFSAETGVFLFEQNKSSGTTAC